MAPKKLSLKQGCPVMLLRNLSTQLVNGTIGEVVDITTEGPVIHFPNVDVACKLQRVLFSGMHLGPTCFIFEPAQNVGA